MWQRNSIKLKTENISLSTKWNAWYLKFEYCSATTKLFRPCGFAHSPWYGRQAAASGIYADGKHKCHVAVAHTNTHTQLYALMLTVENQPTTSHSPAQEHEPATATVENDDDDTHRWGMCTASKCFAGYTPQADSTALYCRYYETHHIIHGMVYCSLSVSWSVTFLGFVFSRPLLFGCRRRVALRISAW